MSVSGYSLVLSACLMSAMGIVLTKLTSSHVEKLIILFYLGLAITICGTIGLFSLGRPGVPPLRDWLIGITIGLLGLVQQYVLVWAIQVGTDTNTDIQTHTHTHTYTHTHSHTHIYTHTNTHTHTHKHTQTHTHTHTIS